MTYSEKLLDPRWQKLRLDVLNRENFTCEYCSDPTTTLHVHHEKYAKSKNPWDVEIDFLTCVCKHCHALLEYCKTVPNLVPPKKCVTKINITDKIHCLDVYIPNLMCQYFFVYNEDSPEIIRLDTYLSLCSFENMKPFINRFLAENPQML